MKNIYLLGKANDVQNFMGDNPSTEETMYCCNEKGYNQAYLDKIICHADCVLLVSELTGNIKTEIDYLVAHAPDVILDYFNYINDTVKASLAGYY